MSILEIIGGLSIILFVGKLLYILYERLVVKPKDPTSYGKWVIITGSTSGIGKEYAEYLGKRKMNILLISRSKDKLIEQQQELKEAFNVEVKYIAYDFTVMGEARDEFYKQLNIECEYMHENGGIGLLINNVGIANQYPQRDDELTDIEESNMINCNIDSTVFMSRTVLKYMSKVNKGAILNLSSGSGNIPSPYIAMYSSTKAFITQYSRSLHFEYINTGIDVLVITPFYFVSNKYRKNKGTLFAPMPIALVKGGFNQLGKKGLWQAHGYWVHTIVGKFQEINPLAPYNGKARCEAHRANYQKKLAKEKKQ